MSQRFEGKIKKILTEEYNLSFEIEYIDGKESILVKSITYSTRYSNHNYNKNDSVEFELLEDNKAKIINNNLIERETRKDTPPIWVITVFLLVILLWIINLVTENIIFSYIGPCILIIMICVLIWTFVNAFNTDKKGVDVKGKVISKKVRVRSRYNRHLETFDEYDELVLKILYNDKVYEIEGPNSINIGDEVEITLYKNRACLTKNKGINYKALPLLVLFISAIGYLIAFDEKIDTNKMYLVPVFILLIIMFIYIPFATDDKKRKKKKTKNK